jgi:hypothetical protein
MCGGVRFGTIIGWNEENYSVGVDVKIAELGELHKILRGSRPMAL